MLVFGGIIGVLLGVFIIGIPMATAMAMQIGIQFVMPIVGMALTPLFSGSIFGIALIHIVIVLLCYILVVAMTPVPIAGRVLTAPPGAPPAPWQFGERFGRGVMIGLNAGVNLTLVPFAAPWLVSWSPVLMVIALAAVPLFMIAAPILFIVNLMALDEGVCAAPWYAALVGWGTWCAPTAWPVTWLALCVVIVEVVCSWLGLSFVVLTYEWWTGSIVRHGGLFNAFWNPPTAFNMGNVLMVDPRLGFSSPSYSDDAPNLKTVLGLQFHESGHTLNMGTFGCWFWAIGAIHENIPALPNSGARAYPELLAEGHARESTRPWFPLWAPPVVITALGSNVPPIDAGITAGGIPPFSLIVTAVGDLIPLSAATATDPDGFPQAAVNPSVTPALGFFWVFDTSTGQQPVGANPLVLTATAATADAIVDRGGDYLLWGLVSDGIEGPPVFGSANWRIAAIEARANGPYTGTINTPITLAAAGSAGGTAGSLPVVPPAPPPATLLVLAWSIIVNVPGATATLAPAGSPAPIFTTDTPGAYTVQLTVTDGITGAVSHSSRTTVIIT